MNGRSQVPVALIRERVSQLRSPARTRSSVPSTSATSDTRTGRTTGRAKRRS